MNESKNPASMPIPGTQQPPSSQVTQQVDYAAWVDNEGREHLITPDMVDEVIEEMISGPDYSLQGRGPLNSQPGTVKYSQPHPH